MPYHIAKFGSGYKLVESAGGHHPGRTFSHHPISRAKAEAQRRAIAANMHGEGGEKYAAGGGSSGGPGNPFAICTASVGRENKSKYEDCVMDVKHKEGKA